MSRAVLWLMYLIHFLPVPAIRALGSGLGRLLCRFGRARRRVARINIGLCFPELDEAARERLVREVFVCFAQSVLDRALLWHGSEERVRDFVQVENMALLDARWGRPLIILAPHFAGMEAGGMRLSIGRPPMMTMFSNQKDPHFNRALYEGRKRFHPEGVMVSRQDGVRRAVRELANGTPFYFLPDMDLGPRDAIFVPFFGTPAATVTAVSRLAQLTGAAVMPCVTRMSGNGYISTLHPAWDDFPSGDVEEDTRRMNTFIEAQVRAMPAQYHWLHKRFKTRPPGEASFY
ncbi:MAG: Lauroyl/myristoyl acyltransferase [Betaproteobacteria bacterium]|nr:Lauroyl/myristoyl acyltransferase [Betaproteobacteria bacterium]